MQSQREEGGRDRVGGEAAIPPGAEPGGQMAAGADRMLMPLEACDLPLDRLLDDYVEQGRLPSDTLDSFKAALSTGRLSGWVAVEAGRAAGLVAFEARQGWGQIDLVHAPNRPTLFQRLLVEAVADLHHREGARQIVTTLHWPKDSQRKALLGAGFVEIERQEMVRPLNGLPPMAKVPPGYRLAAWHPRYRDAAAHVMWRGNQGLPDAQIYPPMQTEEGCRSLVAKTVTGGWGEFLAAASPVALDGHGTVVGVLLAGRVARGVGHVFEVVVLPAHQRAGLGKALITTCMAQGREVGLSALHLTVSLRNVHALRLYRGLGFRDETQFSAFVWRAGMHEAGG
jgi:ribosomal protein S18 acetylase RimI-like enzyme